MSQRRRKPSSPLPPDADDSFSPLGYVLEWTPQSRHHRHRLDTVENLRSELLGGRPSGVDQLIVLRGDVADAADVRDALRSLATIDDGFLESLSGRPYRPRSGSGRAAIWCAWRYPEEEEEMQAGGRTVMRRAALWLSAPVPVLLVDTPLEPVARRCGRPAPRLRHQDAATRRSGLQRGDGGRYGAVARQHYVSPLRHAATARVSALDDELASAVDCAQDSVHLEEVLAEIVYERWAARIGALSLGDDGDGRKVRLLWGYIAALERNIDDARFCSRMQPLQPEMHHLEHTSAAAAWAELSRRVQLRVQLATSSAATSLSSSSQRHRHHGDGYRPRRRDYDHDDEAMANERSLDRIAYLGGVLLPVSIVAGVLAIEGRYGPEGARFWVFWAASAAASVIALLVIYLDQLRLDDVWVAVPGSGSGVEAGGGRVMAAARAWRREQLGWTRAMKRASGYYRLRGARWIRFQSPSRHAEDRVEEEVIVVEEE